MPESRPSAGWSRRERLVAPLGVFVVLLASYGCYWQARDWNSASRLMLTYAIVDRGTIRLDGLQRQTGDIARYDLHYYTDKQPGYSLLAAVPYAAAKAAIGLDDHPVGGPALRRWPGDYWATLGASGLATALCGAVVVGIAGRLGCRPRAAALIGLAYGLATPAYAYATMSYGHQVAAASLIGALALIDRPGERRSAGLAAAGALAAFASVVELSVGPVSAILGLRLLAKAGAGSIRPSGLLAFAAGAAGPSLLLIGYNVLAFGSPFDIGYAHHDNPLFSPIHGEGNPLGLGRPDRERAAALLWGRYRGLCFYAPILMLAPIGWAILALRREAGLAIVTFLACLAVFLVNVCYPEWTGGWSTGPRLLVPLLPFGMIGVAGALSINRPWATGAAAALTIAGAALMLLFVGVGGQIPQYVGDPLTEVVWPLWAGRPLPPFREGHRFTVTIAQVLAPGWVEGLGSDRGWLQFVPIVATQAAAIAALMATLGRARSVDDR